MELQFHKTPAICLDQVVCERTARELTQELKLSEDMPDAGAVICAWGQILIRGKHWDSDSVGSSGGVQVWVLYTSEDGSEHRVVETWLPFEQSWELSDPVEDGKILLIPALNHVDARVVSQRKLMIKVSMGICCKAFISDSIDIYTPGAMPEDVQLLVREWSALIPSEVGERAFVIDEEIIVPTDLPKPEKLICCTLIPLVNESKVMAGKLVFRGSGHVHMIYQTGDRLYTMDMDVPFAQYSELEGDYDPDATVSVFPVLTSFEAELSDEGVLRLKAGLLGQYIACDKRDLKVVEDAYSTQNQIVVNTAAVKLSHVAQQRQWTVTAQNPADLEGKTIDTVFYGEMPKILGDGSDKKEQFTGRFQRLYYDNDGILRCDSGKWEQIEPVKQSQMPMTDLAIEQVSEGEAQIRMNTLVLERESKEIVCGITMGDALLKDPSRPSLVLRRMGEESIWELAKRTGSTVSDIQKINDLDTEPEPGTMLILPVQ